MKRNTEMHFLVHFLWTDTSRLFVEIKLSEAFGALSRHLLMIKDEWVLRAIMQIHLSEERQ